MDWIDGFNSVNFNLRYCGTVTVFVEFLLSLICGFKQKELSKTFAPNHAIRKLYEARRDVIDAHASYIIRVTSGIPYHVTSGKPGSGDEVIRPNAICFNFICL